MKSNDTSWAGIVSHIEQYVVAVEPFGIVARDEVPHHNLIARFPHTTVLLCLHPTMGRTKQIATDKLVGLLNVSKVAAHTVAETTNVVERMVAEPIEV